MNLAASLCKFKMKTPRKIPGLQFMSVRTFYVIRAETGYELEVKGCLIGHFAEILKLKTSNCGYRYPVGRNRLGCYAIALLVHLYPVPIGQAAEMVCERILCKPSKAITSKVIIIRLKCLWNRCRSEQEQIGNRPVRRRKTCSFIVHIEYHFCTVIESPYFYILFYNSARVSVRKQAAREYMEELRDPFIQFIAANHKLQREKQVKIKAIQTKLYPKKNHFSFHCVMIIYFN